MKFRILVFLLTLLSFTIDAQRKKSTNNDQAKSAFEELPIAGLKFRSIGPALTSGRISDFAVHAKNPKEYYVAVSSGGVWKTSNAGTTYTPIFDSEGSYSIGCVTIDPNNPNVVWVGTGENNNQRSVAYGDGIYKSVDGGKSWSHMGLKNSEHIGKILVDPRNSDVIYVAAIGPLWSGGGDRGVYKTTDGGKTWAAVLTIDQHTGVNDIIMDPRDPDVLYAAAYQRRRHVFTYLGGGPGSGMYKTTNGGASWDKINKGLPKVDMGRIGLAMAPSNPGIIYAIVEAAQGKGGFFKTTNRGASWVKQGSYQSSGNYYQEIVVDPNDPETIYGMNTWMQVSRDGGKTFKVLGEVSKHVDNHCLWIDPDDSDHFIAGCDGGIYESWDGAKTWDFKANLPVTQFYKVALDNAEPFYHVYGGTQDNFSLGGPSRSISGNGIANEEWWITHGGDGFETQVDQSNANIIYAQSQYGVLVRYDKSSGEEVGIQPQPRKNENAYRWNWDAPLVISNYDNKRLYFAANKVFRSNDQGNSWEVISEDLTQQINRNELKVMDRVWGIDAIAKNGSTSPYGTIVAMDESPKNENLLYVGTDDGLIQVTENGGDSWTRVSSFPGVPSRTYVNMVLASQHDVNVVFACFNNHKNGDFKPYVFKSTDKGRTWRSITSNLPARGSSYSIAQDHVDPNLLFVGTEFGVFVSNDGGGKWKQMKAGVPTIAVRDLAIQRRENDLVLGTFGRGFYVLDDYSALRNTGESTLAKEAELFDVRDPYLYEHSYPLGLPGVAFQGDSYYLGDNLGPVAMFTYYLKDGIKSLKEQRREREKEAKKEGKDTPYPSYDALKLEREEKAPQLLFTVSNSAGNVVRKIMTKPSKGLNRVTWDLRYTDTDPINLSKPSFYNPWGDGDKGILVAPGDYTVTLSKVVLDDVTQIAGPVSFTIKTIDNRSLPATDRIALNEFNRKVLKLSGSVGAARQTLREINHQVKHINDALVRAEVQHDGELVANARHLEKAVAEINTKLGGDRVAGTLDMGRPPSVGNRVGMLVYQLFASTSDPTQTNRDSYAIAVEEFKPILASLQKLVNEDLKGLQDQLVESGAPYTPYSLPNVPQFED
ncbi:MAG: glycosyl hydrolase [Cytophagales bacterium]|nr:glycosyl hydrolase [Cytophagales bacterium]